MYELEDIFLKYATVTQSVGIAIINDMIIYIYKNKVRVLLRPKYS